MQKYGPFILVGLLLIALAVLVARPSSPAQALPEYSAQTGEPCASCHYSPSGGGVRTPRGQAWVGSGKPGIVPGLVESLELLGVHMEVDETDFLAPDADPAPPEPLPLTSGEAEAIYRQLQDYRGN